MDCRGIQNVVIYILIRKVDKREIKFKRIVLIYHNFCKKMLKGEHLSFSVCDVKGFLILIQDNDITFYQPYQNIKNFSYTRPYHKSFYYYYITGLNSNGRIRVSLE